MKLISGRLTIEISFPLAAVMTAVILYDCSVSVLVCLIAIILHEGGHLLALYRNNSFPESIRLTLFDIAIKDTRRAVRGFKQELTVILAGIASNILFFSVSTILNCLFPCIFLRGLAEANLSLALFNSLPVDSLDGGQALLLILSRSHPPDRAVRIVDIISLIILFPLLVPGFMLLLQSRYNFSLLLTALYLIAVILCKRRRTSDDI